MALIPPSGSAVLNITSGTGSGIVANNTINGTQLLSGLVAGTNVSLTPVSNFGGKGLRIDANPGSSGVASVTAGNSYITIGGTSINPTVANNGVQTLSAGTGITVGGTANQPTVSNAGVLGVTSGNAGITVGGTAQNPTISNAGVLGVTASGAGIAVSGTAQNPNIQNTGVTSLVAGANITLSGSTGAVTISAASAPPASVPKLGSMTFSFSSGGFPISPSSSGYYSIFFNGQMLTDFQNGVSDPNGTWVVFIGGLNFIMSGNNSSAAGVFISNSLDAGTYAINGGSAIFSSVIAGASNRVISCPAIALPVNAVRSAMPNLYQNVGVRFNITNLASTSDQIFPQGIPLLCYAQYFPNGVQ